MPNRIVRVPSASPRRWRPRWGALLAVLSLAACGQGGDPRDDVEALAVTSARATSATSISVTFSHPVVGADDPADYVVRDPGGARLAVVDAYVKDEGRLVVLATEPQRLVDYELEVVEPTPVSDGLRASALLHATKPVAGSAVPAPFVQSATALDDTHVLVTFEDPVGPPGVEAHDDALDPVNYLVVEPALEVHEVRFADGPAERTAVVLTTDALGPRPHRLQVGGVTVRPKRVLIDPFRNEAVFGGVDAEDDTPPRVVDVRATDATTVVVQFDEPVSEAATDPSMFVLTTPEGEVLQVVAARLTSEGTRIVLTTEPMEPGVPYALVLDGVQDVHGNVVEESPPITFPGATEDGHADLFPPRVVGATSMSGTRVLVTFSEPVQGGMGSAENPGHYEIVGSATRDGSLSTQATLQVRGATLSENGRSVTLETGPQSDIMYTLRVTNVFDEAGNPVEGPTRDRPREVDFFGTPVSGGGADSDGDGLSDAAEQRGWTVVVYNVNGETARSEVTSDPGDPTLAIDHPVNVAARDTDQDGLTDAQERSYLTNPRAADTDGDELTDAQELNLVYSEPSVQDTDGDGLPDGLEFSFFGTSPRTDDTDGDQFTDDYEVDADNRNPRIADLPTLFVDVGAVDLQIDVRFEEETRQGRSTLDTKSVNSTLERSSASTAGTERSSTFEWFAKAGLTAGLESGTSGVEWSTEFAAEGGVGGASTATFSTESTEATQRAFATSLATEQEVSAESTVNRVVEGASLAAEVNLTNPTNVAFTVRNIEITVMAQDARQRSALAPVATLFAANDATIDIGPLTSERGPFRFISHSTYPSLIEGLMKNPRGLVFRVANYTLEDEFGRRFAFVEQDVNDRTAFLEINFGGAPDTESYRVATNGTFDAAGNPSGVTMSEVMEDILGLVHVPEGDSPTQHGTTLQDSYSTAVDADSGVQVLTRVRGVGYDPTDPADDARWWVLTPDGLATPTAFTEGRDFRSTVVRSGQGFAFKFVTDADDDGLEASLEALNGSSDSDPDTDGDGIPDGVEVFGYGLDPQNDRDPWIVRFEDGRDAYRTHANPARADTDGDGLSDCQELVFGADGTTPLDCATIEVYLDGDGLPTLESEGNGDAVGSFTLPAPLDPADPDTDGDGLLDLDEVIGFDYVDLEGGTASLRPDFGAGMPALNPLSRDTDGDRLGDLQEIRLGTDPTGEDQNFVLDDDGDGLVNRVEEIGWEVAWYPVGTDPDDPSTASRRDVTSDPDRFDTDGDGLSDLEELETCRDRNDDGVCSPHEYFGPLDPRDVDTDGDGLTDFEEINGVSFPADASNPLRHTDPLVADTDGDGRSDGEEVQDGWLVVVANGAGRMVYSDPVRADADGDGLNDADEKAVGTDPNAADTDGDGTTDQVELDRGTQPLVPDDLVSVSLDAIRIGPNALANDDIADCEAVNDTAAGSDVTDSGDFRWSFRVRTTGFDGGSVYFTQAFETTHADHPLACGAGENNDCFDDSGLDPGVAFGDPERELGVVRIESTGTSDIAAGGGFSLPHQHGMVIDGWVEEVVMGTNGDGLYGPIDVVEADAPDATNARFEFGGLSADSGGVYTDDDLPEGFQPFSFMGDEVQPMDAAVNETCKIVVEGFIWVR